MVVNPYVVQLGDFRNRLLIALFGGVQKVTALICLFFLGVRSGPSFHAIPCAKTLCAIRRYVTDGRRRIHKLYQKPRRFGLSVEGALAARKLAISLKTSGSVSVPCTKSQRPILI
jgi:hypothetical protein